MAPHTLLRNRTIGSGQSRRFATLGIQALGFLIRDTGRLAALVAARWQGNWNG
jgi:hypothetical protein